MPQMRALSKFARTRTGSVVAATKTTPLAFCAVIGSPPIDVPTAPAGRISAGFWMLSCTLLTNTVSVGVDTTSAEAHGAVDAEARLGHQLFDRAGRWIRHRADAWLPTVAPDSGDVRRRHLEPRSGQAQRAEVGHVRSAETAADVERRTSRLGAASTTAPTRKVTLATDS